MDILETKGTPSFSKPPHLGPLAEGARALEDACHIKYGQGGNADPAWREKVRVGYERTTQTLWRVAREFDVRGYGWVLRDKLTSKWCECGCSTDHLSEVCEKTVAEDEEESGVRPGKEREWDGRGALLCTRYHHIRADLYWQGVVYMAGRRTRKKIFGKWISILSVSSRTKWRTRWT